jgi:hypothetical protein
VVVTGGCYTRPGDCWEMSSNFFALAARVSACIREIELRCQARPRGWPANVTALALHGVKLED